MTTPSTTPTPNNWTTINLPWRDLNGSDFKRHPLCKAGVLIRVKEAGLIKEYLIGNINELGGFCDDCSLSGKAMVLEAKVVYEV